MHKTFFPALVFFSILLLNTSTGCKKDNTKPKTKTELLSQSSWKFSSASASGTDVTNNAAIACIKDDVITFSAAGTGSISEGSIICNPTTAGNFTWSFQNTETQLQMSSGIYPAGSGLFTINFLTETILVITQDVLVPPSATPIPVTATYIH